ncbi:MAG TPA: trypsin-like peptidase domain-containing protein [Terriglobia bacterium]|nr:trypsin-like peptidase domain-containing protein [Terriglobia bacterium]
MMMKGRWQLPALVVAATLGVGILIGTLIESGVRAAKPFNGAPDARTLPVPSPAELSNSFARIAETIEPAVVNINTESTVHISRRRNSSPDDAPFDDFFDRLFRPDGPQGDSGGSAFRQQSLGSGVILDKNGYIMTNYHVVMRETEDKPVDRIRVFLHDDDNPKGYVAKIVGADKPTDLAVIKIDTGKPLAMASFGDSDSMRVGDWVLAVGSPFGLDATVTAGIISAKGRNSRSEIEPGPEGQFKRFIQTDAAINPGNSGGPLVNLAGQVIGINTAIATRHGTSDGVGFAMPANTARTVYNAIISSGSVHRGAIGVTFSSQPNPAKLRSFGAEHGVVIESVEPGTPAERAGLKLGDVIVAIDGKRVSSGDDLVDVVANSDIGRKLKIDFLRDRRPMSATVAVADRNQIVGDLRSAQLQPGEPPPGDTESAGVLGVTVRALTHEQTQKLADRLHLGTPQVPAIIVPGGVRVTDVKPESFAEELGLQPGDVVLEVNRKRVASVDDFNQLQSQLKRGSDVLLLVARPTGGTYTTLFLADRL